MTRATALQVFFNPDDLELTIGEVQDKQGIWGIQICRGPRNERHPFNLLITSEKLNIPSKSAAIVQMKELLEGFKKIGDELFASTDPDQQMLKRIFCNNWQTREEYAKNSAPVLEDMDIERIMK